MFAYNGCVHVNIYGLFGNNCLTEILVAFVFKNKQNKKGLKMSLEPSSAVDEYWTEKSAHHTHTITFEWKNITQNSYI